ncbi:MAG: KpsF/GutQ family sugar-phosphate isomerase [Sphingobium sp.]|nr:KpsF/GutQ family sugar-phosphate isomerase [Sphingobium sp.]MBP6111167.1 KpsF/GutQ family sugar-phosphate isomerase [Sphingobium sp.]MBP8669743.1 KpsF/GutQ family sugar-phosphate isomerase [Sphingobium sp.]MBP9156497.1 KpsF/GutQ family sugar-phosphate isomerase [Sphingobium sp.]
MIKLVRDPDASVLSAARRVLVTEAAALQMLADTIPLEFESAVAAMLNAPGRIIVSGIGKSGHIGRKISATLSSTGSPSTFMHAAEASHGDLGMITRDDICLLLSNSGETAELRDIVAYVRRFEIPLIAISARANSVLMRAADYKLLLPDAPEACPNGLAPTTSTALMLALGDALAIALMEARGFAVESFRQFHPGGRLGAQITKVMDLMHGGEELPLVRFGDNMAETLLAMTSKGFGIAIVVEAESGKLTGVVTDGDLRRNMAGLMDRTAGEIATARPVCARADMLAAEALALMNRHEISVLPVVDEAGLPLGLLHVHDLLRAGVA